MTPALLEKALEAARLHPRLIAAMLREMLDLKAFLDFQGLSMPEPLDFNKCARQGGIESAWQWNQVVCYLLQDLVPA